MLIFHFNVMIVWSVGTHFFGLINKMATVASKVHITAFSFGC
jgi:hypothetical protein